MAQSYRLGLVAWTYQVRITVGSDICHRGCAYTVLKTVQMPGVYCAAYGTVHYSEVQYDIRQYTSDSDARSRFVMAGDP